MSKRAFKGVVAIFIMVLALPAAALAGGLVFSPPVASQADQDRLDQALTKPQVVRSRLVKVNTDVLLDLSAPDEGQVTLNLFDDVSLKLEKAVLDIAEKKVLDLDEAQGTAKTTTFVEQTYTAKVAGQPGSLVIFSIVNGSVTGSVFSDQGLFRVRWSPGENSRLEQIDQSVLPQENDIAPPADLVASLKAADNGIAYTADDGSQIDIIVCYSNTAVSSGGGADAIKSEINDAVSLTNQAYAASGVTQRVNLLGYGGVDYNDAGDFSTDLDRFTDPNDGVMDIIHTWRNDNAADVMSLIVGDSDSYCGLGWMMSTVTTAFAPNAFSIVRYDCAADNLSLPHEMGHNMGLRHDCYVDTATTPYLYNHGFVDYANRVRTIMAYNNYCTDNGNVYCERKPFFSDPVINQSVRAVLGSNTGACQADAARALDNTAYTVANFRDSGGGGGGGGVTPPSTEEGGGCFIQRLAR